MMKFVTVTIGGITQQVPEADVSLYLRAGYSVVDAQPASATKPDPVVVPAPEPAFEPAPEPEADESDE